MAARGCHPINPSNFGDARRTSTGVWGHPFVVSLGLSFLLGSPARTFTARVKSLLPGWRPEVELLLTWLVSVSAAAGFDAEFIFVAVKTFWMRFSVVNVGSTYTAGALTADPGDTLNLNTGGSLTLSHGLLTNGGMVSSVPINTTIAKKHRLLPDFSRHNHFLNQFLSNCLQSR